MCSDPIHLCGDASGRPGGIQIEHAGLASGTGAEWLCRHAVDSRFLPTHGPIGLPRSSCKLEIRAKKDQGHLVAIAPLQLGRAALSPAILCGIKGAPAPAG
jgi:hypothetical protein